jgi:bleomycin hydrolase
MKHRIFIFSILFALGGIISGQNDNIQSLKGSWLGKVGTNDWSLRVMFRIEAKGDHIRSYLDSPDQGMKGIPLDRVWRVGDSVFVDATKSIHAGIVFKGVVLPGDSVIDGKWGGALNLRLSRTTLVINLKTNTNPAVPGYKIVKLIPTSPLKDQQATGLCWCFATTSFIETEAIRLGKKPVVLSPMFFVIPTYLEKAERNVRMNGKSYFNEGDLTFSVLSAYRKYGAIPESVFCGKKDPSSEYDHSDMIEELQQKVKSYIDTGRGNMTMPKLRSDISAILEKTMSSIPDTFIYNSREFTPQSFATEMIGINPDDYIEITSFSHHPFYSKFILEIESNWDNNYYLNLPSDDFLKVIENSLSKGYSLCWDGDIYQGYGNGFAVLNDTIKTVTQLMRQQAFDNHTTEDIHNMHIVGIAENNNGDRFYIVKNSSDTRNCGGYLYMSKEYLLQKTISVMVHKDVIPKEIRAKIKIPL